MYNTYVYIFSFFGPPFLIKGLKKKLMCSILVFLKIINSSKFFFNRHESSMTLPPPIDRFHEIFVMTVQLQLAAKFIIKKKLLNNWISRERKHLKMIFLIPRRDYFSSKKPYRASPSDFWFWVSISFT